MSHVPDEIKRRAIKVFSKHDSIAVNHWGKTIATLLHQLHAVEKPMNLDYTKPFANTSDLVENTPNLHVPEDIRKKDELDSITKGSGPIKFSDERKSKAD